MKKYISSLVVLVSGLMFSQTILNASSPEEFRKMREENVKKAGDSVVSTKVKPLSYGYVDEKDILKSMYVWEIIDLNDKINQPFYYDNPDGLTSKQTKSLYNVLLEAIENDKIKEVYDDENFVQKLTIDQIKERATDVRVDDEIVNIINSGRQPTEEEKRQYTDIIRTGTDKVRAIKMFGMWYIDKRDATLKYRPLGIAAMGPDPKMIGRVGPDGMPIEGANDLIDMFWIFYPDAREVLANNYVYNKKNSSADLSFDDLINARRFSTVIYKSSVGLGNGKISDYIPKDAEGQIEESERIKGQILDMENDLWNY